MVEKAAIFGNAHGEDAEVWVHGKRLEKVDEIGCACADAFDVGWVPCRALQTDALAHAQPSPPSEGKAVCGRMERVESGERRECHQ